MTTTKIITLASGSVYETGLFDALNLTDATGGSVTVAADGYLVSTELNALYLSGANWSVNINGALNGSFAALYLDAPIVATNRATINVGADAALVANVYGIQSNMAFTLINKGLIQSDQYNAVYGGDAATITNSGTISSYLGIDLRNSAAHSLVNSGHINAHTSYSYLGGAGIDVISNTGIIGGDIDLGDGTNTLKNSGTVGGKLRGGINNDTITNFATGRITGNIDFFAGTNTLTNAGLIGGNVIGGADLDTITNSGTINGTINTSMGGDTLNNSGTINGAVALAESSDTLNNSGTINGNADVGSGPSNVINNSGRINGNVLGDVGADTLNNRGVITGNVELSIGPNKITNSGTIRGNVTCAEGADLVTDYLVTALGTISGQILGTVDLGLGNDTFQGGANAEHVLASYGADTVLLGGGDDSYLAGPGGGFGEQNDIVNGGTGIDTYDASLATATVYINLDTRTHSKVWVNGTNFTNSIANSAFGFEISGDSNPDDVNGLTRDSLSGFENAVGGSGWDWLWGTAGNNRLLGNAGQDSISGMEGDDFIDGGADGDQLEGGLGNDRIYGGNDADILIGDQSNGIDYYKFTGAGNDLLDGGAGGDSFFGNGGRDTMIAGIDSERDWFFYTDKTDSGVTATTRDVIQQFGMYDLIALGQLDADQRAGAASAGDQAFALTADNGRAGFTAGVAGVAGTVGQIRFQDTAAGMIVWGEVNGDKIADFSILVAGVHSLAATDFLL